MHDTLDYMQQDPIHRKLPPRRLTFSHLVRLHRELRAAAVARRGGARQGLAARQDAGRRLAAVRQPALLLRLHVGAPGQEAAVHGRRVRPAARVEPRRRARLAACCSIRSTRACSAGSRTSTALYRDEPALHERRLRRRRLRVDRRATTETRACRVPAHAHATGAPVLVVCNFTPVPRANYRVGVPRGGRWRELLNSDAAIYGGSGMGNLGGVDAAPVPAHGRVHSLTLTLPPLATIVLQARSA